MADRLAVRQDGFAIFEATGDYDRHLRGAFDARAIAYARVNPQQARDFARAMGRRAKSDALDAGMLARMAQALELAPTLDQPTFNWNQLNVEKLIYSLKLAQLSAFT